MEKYRIQYGNVFDTKTKTLQIWDNIKERDCLVCLYSPKAEIIYDLILDLLKENEQLNKEKQDLIEFLQDKYQIRNVNNYADDEVELARLILKKLKGDE